LKKISFYHNELQNFLNASQIWFNRAIYKQNSNLLAYYYFRISPGTAEDSQNNGMFDAWHLETLGHFCSFAIEVESLVLVMSLSI